MVRYERVQDVVRLAVRLQGSRGGMTLYDMQADFSVSRRTAERLRDAVEAVFGPLEIVDKDDNRRHWRLRSDVLRRLVFVSAEELAQITSAAEALERAGFGSYANALLDLAIKLHATLRTDSLARVESDLESLVLAEGLAMRPGPRSYVDPGLLALLREAILTCRVVEFRYFAQSTARSSRQRVRPLGLLYGNRAFLVAMTDWSDEPRLWRLANVSEVRLATETFDRDPEFDLLRYAKRSFGTFQEEPVDVALRFDAAVARDASAFLFHPDQAVEENGDGSVTVRFTAGGVDEMCWHLFTWGESVTVEKPARLRRRLAEMCATRAAHHQRRESLPEWERIDTQMTDMRCAVYGLQTRLKIGAEDFDCQFFDDCCRSLEPRVRREDVVRGDWTYVGRQYGSAMIKGRCANVLFVAMERPSKEGETFKSTQGAFRSSCFERSIRTWAVPTSCWNACLTGRQRARTDASSSHSRIPSGAGQSRRTQGQGQLRQWRNTVSAIRSR